MPDELKRLLEFPEFRADNMSKLREVYLATGMEPDHRRYGWMRAQV